MRTCPDKLTVTPPQLGSLLRKYFDPATRRNYSGGLWGMACDAMGWPKGDKPFRIQKLSEILGREISSASEIGRIKEFSKVKGDLLALAQPANLNAQKNIVDQPLIVLRFSIRLTIERAGLSDAYWQKICRDKFGMADIDMLNETQLEHFRNTLCARISSDRRGDIVEPESDLAGEAWWEQEMQKEADTHEQEGVPF